MNEKALVHGAVAKHLSDVAGQLAIFLERVLPPLFDDWWNKAVVNTLSFQQKRRLEQRNITSLGGLDLAGLLRVLDQNWYQISNSLDLTSEARHFVKEMQTVRNHWAHADTEGFPVDDIYRDLDTLQRFAVVIRPILTPWGGSKLDADGVFQCRLTNRPINLQRGRAMDVKTVAVRMIGVVKTAFGERIQKALDIETYVHIF
jgi:hypothetical protein